MTCVYNIPDKAVIMQLTPDHHPLLLNIAKDAIRASLADEPPGPLPDDPILQSPAGCFVSLHTLHTHQLRGCVGRLDAELPLTKVVARMAVAVLDDPRFRIDPVTLGELADLEIELSIISTLSPAQTPEDFDPQTQGIYLTCQNRTGCFLPQVARETGWSKQELLDRLCYEKLGLSPDAWREPDARLQTFTATLIGPEPFLPTTAAPP